MTKNEFLKLNRNIGQLPPDVTIRTEYLENQFLKMGLSKENGYKSVQYFYNELRSARDNQPSVFSGTIVNNENDFGIVDHLTCYFKMTHKNFDSQKTLYFPDEKGINDTKQETTSLKSKKQIPSLPEIFKSKDYFEVVIKHLENDEFIELNRITGRFKWLKSKAYLAGLAFVLERNNRLQNLEKYPNFKINTDKKQDLGRVFCNYFDNVTFNEIQEKAFQNSSITGTHRKNYFWIREL